nr:IS30 family transposase [Nocardiopsis terrae]
MILLPGATSARWFLASVATNLIQGVVVPGKRLCRDERVQIQTLWEEGYTYEYIGQRIHRPRCTVWREIHRNNSYRHGPKNPRGQRLPAGRRGGYRWGYDAGFAQRHADQRTYRPKKRKCAPGTTTRFLVQEGLKQHWSPTQIAARLRVDFPDFPEVWVSHETIYQALYVQGRGSLRAEIARQDALRSGRTGRRPRSRAGAATRSRKPWAYEAGFHISDRPAEAHDRALPGHWEGDLVAGARGSSAIVTLVERSSRYVMLGALPQGWVSAEVIGVLTRLAGRLPAHLRRSLAWDQGSEMARHADFTVASGCRVFFCDPHSPWQRGSNENTNGLLRQYFPRSSTDFRDWSQEGLDGVAAELNGRPRQTLGWATPAEVLNEFLVATTT